ncbi:PAPI, partial [Symbiodinium microadriaticum]
MEDHPFEVIGTKGQQIAEIRQKSGAQVDVDKSPTGCRVRFVGTQSQVDVAKAMINAIMTPPTDSGSGEYLEIPRSAVGRIIGAGGTRIQELQERSGAKIDIDRQPDRCLVRFGGFPDNVQLAKTLVTEVLEGRDRTQLAEAAATMEIPPSVTGRLIGPGGRQINEIQERSGAKIDLDK